MSNSADKVLGVFSIRMAMACVFGSLLSTAIGTTAPFSAMSGAVISTALLRVDPLPPSAFTVSATLFVSNAVLFHSCASASPGLMIPAAAARASTPPPVFSTSRRLASTSSSLDDREIGILPWPPSECDGTSAYFPAASCVRVAHDSSDPDSVVLRLWMPRHLFGAARLRLDVPGLVRSCGARVLPAVERAGESGRAPGHQLRISLLPLAPRADRCLSLRSARAGRLARRRTLDHRPQPSQPSGCRDGPFAPARRGLRDEGRADQQSDLWGVGAPGRLYTQRRVHRRRDRGGQGPPGRRSAPPLPGRNPHDASAGESSEGRSAPRLEALGRSHSDGTDRNFFAFSIQGLGASSHSCGAGLLPCPAGKALHTQGQLERDDRRTGSLSCSRARPWKGHGSRRRTNGAAVMHGIEAAHAAGFTHVLTMDSDGQHPSELIGEFMAASAAEPSCMVLGVPVFDASAPNLRVRGRRVSNWWANLETLWTGIGDSLFGFRVYPITPLRKVMRTQHWMRRFDFDPEAVVRMCWLGVRPLNKPAPVRYFHADEGGVSHFNYWRDNALLTWMHVRLMFGFVLRLPLLAIRRLRAS